MDNITNQKISGPLTREEYEEAIKGRVGRISVEFFEGFKFMQGFERTVTFFGSAKLPDDAEHCVIARKLAGKIAAFGIGVVTGGGPGIMEAANRGAYEARGFSIGLNIKLPVEQKENPYLTESMLFKHFYIRKVFLTYAAEAYIFFPGGFGTLDEFFEVMTLIQTKKIKRVPIILVGSAYWKPFDSFIHSELFEKHEMIAKEDMDLYTITDDLDEVVDIVRHAPIISQV